MKVALVYDRVNKMGGAERILLALHEIFPEAPLYTAVYDKKGAAWARDIDVRPTWLNHVPFAKNHHELYPWLTPFAFESLNFDEYDIVISITSAEAKCILTKPKTKHICYCLTPTRYLWSGFDVYANNNGIFSLFLKLFAPMLRKWDLVASTRPDTYLAISNHVKHRIETYYHRTVDAVMYPPVDTDTFVPRKSKERGQYYIFVSRLVSYKRPDIVIDAFNELPYQLIVIGSGTEEKNLRKRARKNIIFITNQLTDNELASYYQKSRGFVFAGDEDFGIVAAEALSSGTPVIAYKTSGISEIVQDGTTGILFPRQTKKSLQDAIQKAEKRIFDPVTCHASIMRFDRKRFKNEFRSYIENVYNRDL